jgi:hypothetical protein
MMMCHWWFSGGIVLLIKAWGLWHIIATVLFLIPQNPAASIYSDAVRTYMIPFFNQDWHLFSPRPPTSSLHYWIKCSPDRERLVHSKWIDPMARQDIIHKALRVTGHGRAKRIDEYLVSEVWSQALDVKARQFSHGELKSELSLQQIKHGPLLAEKALSSCRRAFQATGIVVVQIQIAQYFAKNWSEVAGVGLDGPSARPMRGVSILFEPVVNTGLGAL